MSEQKIYKPRPVTGFPEWLPEERRIEQQWFDHIRKVFESYGFCSIETPSVEELDVLRAKGEVDKEIYVIERLHKDEQEKGETRLALHFDQTVPLARYVAQHFNELVFPFKRYQMQRVWRGERPQAGRFREFYQCDIDVIGVDGLSLHFDAELPAIMCEILQGLNVGPFQMKVSNRKILMGLCAGLGIADPSPITRAVDKVEKIGTDATRKLLSEAGLTENQSDCIMAFASIKTTDSSFVPKVQGLKVDNEILSEGLEELSFVMDNLAHLPKGQVVADLSIVRGLDYYTGIVYETVLLENPSFGSVCSGGGGLMIWREATSTNIYPELESQLVSPDCLTICACRESSTQHANAQRMFLWLFHQKSAEKLPYKRRFCCGGGGIMSNCITLRKSSKSN